MLLFPMLSHDYEPNISLKRQAFINLKGKEATLTLNGKAAARSCIPLAITENT